MNLNPTQQELSSGIKLQEAKTFVGKNADYYINKWSILKSSPKRINWNFAAFFLSIFWLGYRKMYNTLLIILGIFIVTDIVQVSIGIDINNAIGYAISGALGVMGNSYYLNHMKKKIFKIKNYSSTEGEYYDMLEKAGGTSWLGVLISIAAVVVYFIISVFIYNFV
ncbi:DUF2628 domain-containing protein [Clostridium swellfunianum]|uniref:DUF2628 domain-containing protein n=1 Tax=Clostridium swellfunianum TaxID=1367462 RepID=UPI00202E60E2|nr:DUF2628 domain-containing protein [Clostridium swellfunianum]MCM0647999.1 DUF2628 domain-containing protein [Clostridium swellfunianum]